MITNIYHLISLILMEQIHLLEKIFDPKTISVLKTMFRQNKKRYLQEISEESGVPIATTLRILNKLEKAGVIEIEKVSRVKLYTMKDCKETEFLSSIFKEEVKILEVFIDRIRGLKGLKQVILHGKQQKDRANVLLIGEGMDAGRIKEACASIKDEFGFTINSLSLNEAQYMQMSQMGLYSGNKKILM